MNNVNTFNEGEARDKLKKPKEIEVINEDDPEEDQIKLWVDGEYHLGIKDKTKCGINLTRIQSLRDIDRNQNFKKHCKECFKEIINELL